MTKRQSETGRSSNTGVTKPSKYKPFNAFTDFVPRSYQLTALHAFEEEGKHLALLWSRQLGKDMLSWILMIRMAMQEAGSYHYFLPMTKQAKRVIWLKSIPDMGRIISWIPKKRKGDIHKADGKGFGVYSQDSATMTIQIECVGSVPENIKTSSIELVGAGVKNADDFAGISSRLCVFSEVAPNPTFSAIYQIMFPSMLMNGTRQILQSTPRGHNHWHTFLKNVKGDRDWYTNTTQILFPEKKSYYYVLPPSEIKRKAKAEGMSDALIEQEFGCSFNAVIDGSYLGYSLRTAEDEGRVGQFPYNPTKSVDVFYDIGLRDKAVMWFRQFEGNHVNFIDYFEGVRLGTDEVAETLLDKGYRYRYHVLPWDGNHSVHGHQVTSFARLLREALSKNGVSGTVPDPLRKERIMVGIGVIRRRFQRYRFNEPTCSVGLAHIASYSAKLLPSGGFADTPKRDDHTHCCDALRTEAMATQYYNPTPTKIMTTYHCNTKDGVDGGYFRGAETTYV